MERDEILEQIRRERARLAAASALHGAPEGVQASAGAAAPEGVRASASAALSESDQAPVGAVVPEGACATEGTAAPETGRTSTGAPPSGGDQAPVDTAAPEYAQQRVEAGRPESGQSTVGGSMLAVNSGPVGSEDAAQEDEGFVAGEPEGFAAGEPEELLEPGTPIDEQWFSGDEEYWDAREALREQENAPVPLWRHLCRAAVAAVAAFAMLALLLVPYGGISNIVDFFVNGAPHAPQSSDQAAADIGSPAGFLVQESFNFPDEDTAQDDGTDAVPTDDTDEDDSTDAVSNDDADGGGSASSAGNEHAGQEQAAPGQAVQEQAAQPRYFLTNRGQVTAVRLQSPWQSCWAFAAVSALESSMLKEQAVEVAASLGNQEGALPAEDGTLSSLFEYLLSGNSGASGAGSSTGGQNEAGESGSQTPADAVDDEPRLDSLPSEPDLSERHVAWHAHEALSSRADSGQAGEGRAATTYEEANQLTGGDLVFADVQFTTSKGIAAEADEPYQYNGYSQGDTPWYQLGRSKGDIPAPGDKADARNRDWSLSDAHVTDDNGVLVKAAHILPSPAVTKHDKKGNAIYKSYDAKATDAIKRALVQWGGVAIAYHADVSKPGVELLRYGDGEYFSYENWAQYDSSSRPTTNHAACIVGWDDDYPASNFTGSKAPQPPGNGAWLVKNSWGSAELYRSLGLNASDARRMAHGLDSTGFFWLSYYDHTICTPYAFEVAPSAEQQELAEVYQYDYLAVSNVALPVSVSPAPSVANVFEARSDEELYAVSARTYAPQTPVEVRVVKLASGAKDPADGKTVAKLSATSEYGGFEAFELEEPVALKAGERFAVVEKVLDPRKKEMGYLNLETVASAKQGNVEVHAVANKGETYVSFVADEWLSPSKVKKLVQDEEIDIEAFGNAMIKAYTRSR